MVMAIIIIIVSSIFFLIAYHHSVGLPKNKGSENLTSEHLNNVKNFAVYYGSAVNSSIISYLNNFGLDILQPDIFSSSNLSQINSIKIAYIDLGEFDGTILGNYSINVSSIAIGYDSDWNQTIVNVSSPIWVKFIMYMVNQSISLGYNGVLFDDLDVVEQFPLELQGFINIITEIRDHFPSIIIGVNRGFDVIPYIYKEINFVMIEDFGSYYDFNNSSYQYLNSSQISNLTYRTNYFKSLGIKVFGLGYSTQPFDSMYSYDIDLGLKLQVPVYVSNIMLNATWPQYG